MRRKKIINYKIFSHFFSGLVEWTNQHVRKSPRRRRRDAQEGDIHARSRSRPLDLPHSRSVFRHENFDINNLIESKRRKGTLHQEKASFIDTLAKIY